MNEYEILSAYVSKPRQMKKINGVMTPVYLKPYNKQYNFTPRFIKFNKGLVKQGLTNTILFDDNLIYDRITKSFEKRNKYFRKKRLRPSADKYNKDYIQFVDDVVQYNPISVELNKQGVLYTYRNNFIQQPGTPYHSFMYRLKVILRQYMGQRILIKARLGVLNWEKETTFDIPADGFNSWYKTEKPWLFFEIHSGSYIFDFEYNHDAEGDGSPYPVEDQARMIIFVINNVNPIQYAQAFADDIVNHCVLQPVRDYLEFRIDKAKNKETSTIKKYNSAMNKLINWEMMYPVGKGIPINLLHQFCCDTGFGIDLYLPDASCSGRMWKTYRPPKQPTKIFKFINTRHNHLDITAQVDNNFRETISEYEYDELLKYLYNSDEYYVYNDYSIITQQKIYQIESEYNKITNDFEKDNGLKRFRLNDINPKQETLNNFIKASCIYNGCVDFKDTYMYRELNVNNENDINILEEHYGKKFWNYWDAVNCAEKFYKLFQNNLEKDNVKQIDMSKAYTRCEDSPYFCGYPAKITDMRKCDKIMGVGFYLITDIYNIPEHIKKLGCYFDDNVYASPELKYMKKLGIKYRIIAGCWGTTCKINWGPEKDDNDEYTGMYKKSENNIRNYVKWFGCALKTSAHTTYKYKTDNLQYIENWKYESCNDGEESVDIRYTQHYNSEKKPYYNVLMNIPKQNIYHHTHIASFIYSYQRIMMIEQLLKIPLDNIIRVCVDGIYYNDCDFEIMKNFNVDKKLKFGNEAGTHYRTKNMVWWDLSEFGENKVYNRKEVWTGAGGCGKTYQNIVDKGNCDVIYIAHSWKLAAAKRDEFKGLDVSVVQRLTMDDWFIDGKPTNYWEPIANKYSTLVIDEISTLSDNKKKIIEKRFKHHKLIYCGDIGKVGDRTIIYQCPPIYNEIGDKPFQINNTYKHYHLETNRRCECKKLRKLLSLLRTIIEKNIYKNHGDLKNWVEKNLTIIDKSTIEYVKEDMILSRTHRANEYYDNKYKDIEKYYITEKQYKLSTNNGGKIFGDENIYNGQIFLEKPDIPACKYRNRHGYTIDCIQGETAYHKLFIDINGLSSWSHLYTALSRAKYFKQINILK